MTTKRIGRPPKKVKEINPARQVGRWTDQDWRLIQDAAEAEGTTVAGFAKRVLTAAAQRVLRKERK